MSFFAFIQKYLKFLTFSASKRECEENSSTSSKSRVRLQHLSRISWRIVLKICTFYEAQRSSRRKKGGNVRRKTTTTMINASRHHNVENCVRVLTESCLCLNVCLSIPTISACSASVDGIKCVFAACVSILVQLTHLSRCQSC